MNGSGPTFTNRYVQTRLKTRLPLLKLRSETVAGGDGNEPSLPKLLTFGPGRGGTLPGWYLTLPLPKTLHCQCNFPSKNSLQSWLSWPEMFSIEHFAPREYVSLYEMSAFKQGVV